MSQLLARKLGEVHAFALIGRELLQRAGDNADTAFGAGRSVLMDTQFLQQSEYVDGTADKNKAEKTAAKLRSMMEQYIGDEWDNPLELLEWSGFFLGAAGIHWSLVSELASKESETELSHYAQDQAELFKNWLDKAYVSIRNQV